MRKAEIINHNGTELVYLDYSDLRNKDEVIQLILDGSDFIRNRPLDSVLSLVNVENMYFNNEVRNVLQENVKLNSPHVKKTAVFGLNGLISIMYNSFVKITGRNLKAFKTMDEAIDYLIS